MTYILSDIHGNKQRFDDMLSKLNLGPEDRLYVLGDVIDRGDDGIELLERIRRMPNTTLLLGNHEYMMLACLEDPDSEEKLLRWVRNGNQPTVDALLRKGHLYIAELIRYLNSLPVEITLEVSGKSYRLVHAAPSYLALRNGDNNSTHFMVWHRMTEDEPGLDPNETVIFGHTKTKHYQEGLPMRVWRGEHAVCIDCGCCDPEGRLACLRLEDEAEFYSAV